MKKYEAVIFDLDGVICHTDKYHFAAWKCLADKLGVYFDEQINNRLRGVSRMESLEIVLENFSGKLTEQQKLQYSNQKNEIYCDLLKNMDSSDLSIEVKQTLDQLRRRGYLLAIGSSSKNAGFILKQIGLENYFDAISDGNNITKSKPDPEVFLMAAKFVNKAAEMCLVVEDAKAGIEAARKGGMDCAAIGDAVNCNMADYNLSKFSDILGICE
ncbi:beta-phosphoglucomutase [Anaerocolumna jejuensis DSM 15929]|uniref:Beta-phosphoglucomutase n=1 Tax=Anaerocolumna jejuensis DSM 15929 TaxID=1121322 RepID=A0A1M7CH23_9FIRM|nr:beta-phosphoglucomutase [Anaerocolumna jejuensis]SHL66476.1 beta-phosphoglucomutase [Anaerocolumna jejuensis DSM 15929]